MYAAGFFSPQPEVNSRLGGVKHNKKAGLQEWGKRFLIQMQQEVTGAVAPSRGRALPGRRSPGISTWGLKVLVWREC